MSASSPKPDPVVTEIVRNGVIAVTEEMKTNLMRTAYNMIIYEALDFTTGRTAAPQLPSRPLAGRVERSGEAAERGVGGLRLLRLCDKGEGRLLRASGAPHPRPLPATRFARGGRGAGSACACSMS